MSRALLVDFYELTMAASYHIEGKNQPASFELFFRELPPVRNYLVASPGELAFEIQLLGPDRGAAGHCRENLELQSVRVLGVPTFSPGDENG